MDERMGHTDSSISARYANVTDAMRQQLLARLTEQWEASLAARRANQPQLASAVLDALLRNQ